MMSGQLTWETLPWHIIVDIFSYLPINDRIQARLACSSWSNCFHDRKLWRHFNFHFDTEFDPDASTLTFLHQHLSHLQSISISLNQAQPLSRQRACQLMDVLVKEMRNRLYGFSIRFTGENPLCFNDPALVFAVKNLLQNVNDDAVVKSTLLSVDLNGLELTLDDKMVQSISTKHNFLRKVCIQNHCLTDNINSHSIVDLLESCPYLEELHTFYHSVDSAVIDVMSLPNRKAPFRFLSLSFNRSDKLSDIISSQSWMRLTFAQPSLEVALAFHPNFPHHMINEILKKNMPLVKLDLNVGGWLNEELVHLKETLTAKLRCLSFSTNVDPRFPAPPGLEPILLELVECCDRLQELHCFCVLQEEVILQIKSVRELKHFTLYSSNGSDDNREIQAFINKKWRI